MAFEHPGAAGANSAFSGGFPDADIFANEDPVGGSSTVNSADPENPLTGFTAGGQGFWGTLGTEAQATASITDAVNGGKGAFSKYAAESAGSFLNGLFSKVCIQNPIAHLFGAAIAFAPLLGKAVHMLGPVGASLTAATGIANVVQSINALDGSVCLPTDIAGKSAGGGLAIAKGKAGMSISEVEGTINQSLAKGITIATSISSTSMDAIAGINMACSFVGGSPLGGSTSVTLNKLPAALSIGTAGSAVGQIGLGLAAAGVGAVTPVFNALTFVANSYSSGGIPLTGDTIIPAANPYASLGILTAAGNIAPVFAEQLPETANTNKANTETGFTHPDEMGDFSDGGVGAQAAATATGATWT